LNGADVQLGFFDCPHTEIEILWGVLNNQHSQRSLCGCYVHVVGKYFVYDTATINTTPTPTAMVNAKARLAEAYTCTGTCSSKDTDIGVSYTARGEISDTYAKTPNSGGYYHLAGQYWENGTLKQLSGLPGLPTTISYGPDGQGRGNTVSASSGQTPLVSSTTYNSAGLPTAINLGSGAGDSDSFTYDPNTNRMSQYQFTVNGTSLASALTWNANGMLRAQDITDAFNAPNTQNCTYQYDDLSRIGQVDCGTNKRGQSFAYDPFGNITKTVLANHSGDSFQPTYDPATNRIQTLPGNPPFVVQYDANGNVLNDSLHVYTWDAEGRPLTVDGVGLSYDALGRMVEQNRSGAYTQIVYSPSGGKLALMSAQTLQKALVPLSGRAMAVYNSSGLLYYAHADMLGSIRLGTTPARAMYFDVAYGPFGETYAQSGSVDPAYTGKMADTSQRQDTSGGLYDFPLREYSVQGRWPSPDPAGLVSVCFKDPQTQNRYAYVRNNPMSFVDPLGAQPCDPFFDPFCGRCPFFDPFCGGERRCSPFDPFCHPLLLLPIVRIGRGGGGGVERARRLNLALIPLGIFRALESGGDAGPCQGTTDCSYYKAQCAKATTPSSKLYYCVGAPAVCNSAGHSRQANCVRLQLQEGDNCLNKLTGFAGCEVKNHALAFAFCGVDCSL